MTEQTKVIWCAVVALVLFMVILYSHGSMDGQQMGVTAAPSVALPEKPADMPATTSPATASPQQQPAQMNNSEVIPELEQAQPPAPGQKQPQNRRKILKWPGNRRN